MQVIDTLTAAAVSIAHRVALRPLSQGEREHVKGLDKELMARAMRAMSRVRFADQFRYSIPQNTVASDVRDTLQGFDRDALEVYLLCTCLDTLAGKENYIDLPAWLTAGNRANNGITERNEILDQAFATPLDRARHLPLLRQLLDLYHRHYGVTKSIKDMVHALPAYQKEAISQAYAIYRQNQGNAAWNNRNTTDKVNLITSYLLEIRRNKYTHSANTPATIGGIREARKRLLDGQNNLAEAASITIPWRDRQYVITCGLGDEALFLRELIYACVANLFGLLDEDWLTRVRDTEHQFRILQGLIYELQYNTKIIHYHSSTLFDQFAILDSKLPPQFRTLVATAIVNRHEGFQLAYVPPFLESYLEAIETFNSKAEDMSNDPYARLDTGDVSHRLVQATVNVIRV